MIIWLASTDVFQWRIWCPIPGKVIPAEQRHDEIFVVNHLCEEGQRRRQKQHLDAECLDVEQRRLFWAAPMHLWLPADAELRAHAVNRLELFQRCTSSLLSVLTVRI